MVKIESILEAVRRLIELIIGIIFIISLIRTEEYFLLYIVCILFTLIVGLLIIEKFYHRKRWVLFLTVFICLLSIFFWSYKLIFSPKLKIECISSITTLLDKDGKKAQFKKILSVKVLRGKIVDYKHRNIGATGIIKNFKASSGEITNIEERGGLYNVSISFTQIINKGQSFTHALEFDLENSFIKRTESVTCAGEEVPTDYAEIIVKFPMERPCKKAYAFSLKGGQNKKNEAPPAISQDGISLKWFIKKPNLKREYIVEWEW